MRIVNGDATGDAHGVAPCLRLLGSPTPGPCARVSTDTSPLTHSPHLFPRRSAPEYYLFAVFDGHNGDAAATFAQSSLVPILEAYLPLPEMADGMDGAAAWAGAVQEAMVKTLLEIDQRFAARGSAGGTTATLVLQVGMLVTCVSVGNSRAVLDTGSALIPLTRDHVVATNEAERERLLAAGCTLARMDVTGAGPAMTPGRERGPLRLWPGGVTLSRALGDFTVGPAVLAVPHVIAAMVPHAGARVVVASDGFWRAGGEEAVLGARSAALRTAGHALLKAVAPSANGHDVSVIVADTVPPGDSFAALAERLRAPAEAAAGVPRPKRANSFAVRQPSATKLWALLKGKKVERKGADGKLTTSFVAPAPHPSPHVITDCDVAVLMGLTPETPGEDDPQPIWFEECVRADLEGAIADAWRVWPIARSLALNAVPGSRRVRRSMSATSETLAASGGASPLVAQVSASSSGSGAPDFQRRSILKQAGLSEGGSASDDAGQTSPSSKRVSFAGEQPPIVQRLRRTSSEIVLPNSATPSASILLGQLSTGSEAAWSDAGFSSSGSVMPQPAGARSLSVPAAVRRPPKPSIAAEAAMALGNSPTSRWRASYLTTAAVFTNKGSARQRDRIRLSS